MESWDLPSIALRAIIRARMGKVILIPFSIAHVCLFRIQSTVCLNYTYGSIPFVPSIVRYRKVLGLLLFKGQ